MKMNRAEDMYFRRFFNSSLDNRDWSTSCSNSFTCAETQVSSGISNIKRIHKNSINNISKKTKRYMDPRYIYFSRLELYVC
jgi:hypothetical protein